MPDALILAGMVALDVLILAVWWFIGSRLVPATTEAETPAESASIAPEPEPRLHRTLSTISLVLLAGLIVECSVLMVAILVVFGWS